MSVFVGLFRRESMIQATSGLSRPMGIGITPEGYLAVSDRYNHCIRLYQYKNDRTECPDCIEMDGVCPKCRDHQVKLQMEFQGIIKLYQFTIKSDGLVPNKNKYKWGKSMFFSLL